jgi:hypothetical protein
MFGAMKPVPILIALSLTPGLVGCNKAPQTYSASCSTPLRNWGTEKDGIGHLRLVMPVFVGSDGSVLWNKVAISDAVLRTYMDQASSLNPLPQIVLEVSPSASCSRVTTIRAIMDAAPICRRSHSLCSEGWNWKEWPMVGGP